MPTQNDHSGIADPAQERDVRILLVEDNPFDAELIEYELKQAGLRIDSKRVDNLESYVRLLETASFDLILSDYDLPQFTGAQALKLVQQYRPELPFILVTGAVGEDRAIEILTGGGNRLCAEEPPYQTRAGCAKGFDRGGRAQKTAKCRKRAGSALP